MELMEHELRLFSAIFCADLSGRSCCWKAVKKRPGSLEYASTIRQSIQATFLPTGGLCQMSSSARQRLWATCLGIAVSPETTAGQVTAAIDDYQSSKHWKSQATRGQKRLAKQMGVDISGAANRREVAGVLFEVGLLYAWVFSVWRRETQQKVSWYSELGLPANPAMDIAVKLYEAGHAPEVKEYSTTGAHSGDVFVTLRGKAVAGTAYQETVSRLAETQKQISASQRKTRLIRIAIVVGGVIVLYAFAISR